MMVKRKLLPFNKTEYLSLRYQYSITEAPSNKEELREVGPIYLQHTVSFHGTIHFPLYLILLFFFPNFF